MTDNEILDATTSVVNVKDKANELITQEYVDAIYAYEEAKAKLDVMDSKIRSQLLETMTSNNITEIDNEKWNVKLVCPKPSKTVDVEKLKREGLYDLYTKDKNTKPYVKVSLKYE